MGKPTGTTGSKGKKHELDKFYTKQDIANYFLSTVSNLPEYDLIIEPSAGGGVFLKALSLVGVPSNKVKGYDLDPESDDIEKADWFQVNKEQFRGKRVLVLGNPPFGISGNLAMRFIRESSFADTIAFIIPRSFKKDSVKDRVPGNLWLVHEEDTPKNSFTLDGEDYDVPCVFQIWEKQESKREVSKKATLSEYIDFTSRQNADFRIQRVGGNAGKASLNLDRSVSSNYFVKNKTDISTEELVAIINKINFKTRDYSTGPRSLSKAELITELEETLRFSTLSYTITE